MDTIADDLKNEIESLVKDFLFHCFREPGQYVEGVIHAFERSLNSRCMEMSLTDFRNFYIDIFNKEFYGYDPALNDYQGTEKKAGIVNIVESYCKKNNVPIQQDIINYATECHNRIMTSINEMREKHFFKQSFFGYTKPPVKTFTAYEEIIRDCGKRILDVAVKRLKTWKPTGGAADETNKEPGKKFDKLNDLKNWLVEKTHISIGISGVKERFRQKKVRISNYRQRINGRTSHKLFIPYSVLHKVFPELKKAT